LKRVLLATVALGLLVLAGWIWAGLPSRQEVRALAARSPTKTALMRQREAEAKARKRPLRAAQRTVPLFRVSRSLIQAVISSEDQKFFGHEGIDWAAINSLAQYTDNDFVIETLEEYQGNAERLVDQIAEAIRLADTERLREWLHALRGTSGNIGATAMCRLCREYQEITDERLSEAGPAILWRLRANLQRFRQDLAEGVQLLRTSRQG